MPDDPKTPGEGGNSNEAVLKAIEAMNTQQGKVLEVLSQFGAGLQGMQETFTKGFDTIGEKFQSSAPAKDEGAAPLGNPSLEEMDRTEFATALTSGIMKQVGDLLEGKLKPLGEQMTGMSTSQLEDRLKRQVADATSKHKDFPEWYKEIGELAQVHTTLSVEQLYQLAKTDHPDKVTELAAASGNGTGTNDDDKPSGGFDFGGLTPTSGHAGKGDGRVTDKQAAASQAFDKVFAGSTDTVND